MNWLLKLLVDQNLITLPGSSRLGEEDWICDLYLLCNLTKCSQFYVYKTHDMHVSIVWAETKGTTGLAHALTTEPLPCVTCTWSYLFLHLSRTCCAMFRRVMQNIRDASNLQRCIVFWICSEHGKPGSLANIQICPHKSEVHYKESSTSVTIMHTAK